MPRRVLLVLGLLAAAALLVSACGGAPSTEDADARPSAAPTPTPDVVVAPLTGERVEDVAVASRPVVAAKIENAPAARPQAGLDDADVVFEELTEGGITRFVALFQSRVPPLVGPVRSGRPEDAALLAAYRPLLFMSGARPDVLDRLGAAGVAFHEEDGEVLYRDRSRRSPHNVFAVGEDLFRTAVERVGGASTVGWRFDPAQPDGAVVCGDPCEQDPGAAITVAMSHVSETTFTYDPAAGVYRRLQDGQPQVLTGAGAVGAANVVVLATEVTDGGCCDVAGNRLSETRTVGTGRAVVLRDGQRYEATWTKTGPSDHLAITGADGQSFAFKPGPTWIVLAPHAAVPATAPG
ncbi:MAG TPA: DUF3048 domain-containing protein [Nitriliruptorales bacterium]|nr:DUF3048 domain-containing protein [Nitriliruptorales bacterium]